MNFNRERDLSCVDLYKIGGLFPMHIESPASIYTAGFRRKGGSLWDELVR